MPPTHWDFLGDEADRGKKGPVCQGDLEVLNSNGVSGP